MRKTWIGIIIVLVIGAIVLFRLSKPEKAVVDETDIEPPKPVEVIKVSRGEIRSELQLSGTIVAEARVNVFPKIAGHLIKLAANEGDLVKQDEPLATVEHEELLLSVERAAAALEAAETAYSQTEQLAKVRVHSQIAQAVAQLRGAETSLLQVKELAEIRTVTQIEQAEAGLKSLTANLEKIKNGARAEDRSQALAALNQAEATLANAKNNYARIARLFKNGAVSQQGLESAQTQLDVATAQHKIADEQLQLIDNGARPEDIQAIAAQVEQAAAALKLAQAQAATKTWEKDIQLAQSQVEAARAGLIAAQALETAKSWEAEIIAAKTARTQADIALKLAHKRLKDATIYAPITGIISRRTLDLGGMAVPTAPLFEIVNIKTVKAKVDVIEAQLSQVALRQQASITVDGIKTPFQGTITFISPTLQAMRRTATAEILIDNPNGILKPGMFAKVTVPVEVRPNALLIPRRAIIEDRTRELASTEDGQTKTQTVFVIEGGVSHRRPVQIGLSRNGVVEVLDGLTAGESVVIAGQHALKVDENVTVVNP